MTNYITVTEVDDLLGVTWAEPDNKPSAVNQANIWLTSRLRTNISEPYPDVVIYAGALLAKQAATGQLYADAAKGIQREMVRVEGAIVEDITYQDGAVAVSGVMLQIADLLKPYILKRSNTIILKRL